MGKPFDPAAYREAFMKEIPLGCLEMRFAFEAKGEYGAWVRSAAGGRAHQRHPVHARRHQRARADDGLRGDQRRGAEGPALAAGADSSRSPRSSRRSETGPLWYRGLASEPEATLAPTLDVILERMGARAIVIGHTTVAGKHHAAPWRARHSDRHGDGRTASSIPVVSPSALEMQGDTMTAIYLDRREPLATCAASACVATYDFTLSAGSTLDHRLRCGR